MTGQDRFDELPEFMTAAEANQQFSGFEYGDVLRSGRYVRNPATGGIQEAIVSKPLPLADAESADSGADLHHGRSDETGLMVEYALANVAVDRRVFPANARTKEPLIRAYHDKATVDPEQATKWWDRWPDALLGHVPDEDVIILDIDPRHNGDQTWEGLGGVDIASERRHCSGRGDGGTHQWYKRPPGELSTVLLDAWSRDHEVGHAILDKDGNPLLDKDGTPRWTSGIDLITDHLRFSILPPSIHPATGQPYRWDAEGEPSELPDVLVELLRKPEPKPPKPRKPQPPTNCETPADWYTRTASWRNILEPHGWELAHGDGDEDGSLWKHPNASNAISASVRFGCLFVYSPNTPFEVTAPGDPHGYTRFAAFALLEHGDDASEAASVIRRTMMPMASPRNVESETGEICSDGERLSEEWWQQTPVLEHIALAADSRVISREAVLATTLVNVAAHIPPALHLPGPPRRGAPNLIVITPARPGSGKGSAADCANVLVPPPVNTKRIPLGTAEGLVKTFFQKNPDKEDRKDRPSIRHRYPVIVRTDEIGVFIQQTGRASASGEGLVAQLKQMCSGETLGFGYATDDKRLIVDPLSYRAGMICGVAPAKAAPLFDDRGGGLPERMHFALAFAEHVPADDEIDLIPADPGPLQWSNPYKSNTTEPFNEIRIDDDVLRTMELERLAQLRSDYAGSDLDVHRTYNRLRLAIALAYLHGETAVTMMWHKMAEDVMCSSDSTRQWLLDQINDEQRRTNAATDNRYANRAVTVDEAVAKRQEARELERTLQGARKIWELVSDGRADTVASVRRLMRTFEGEDWEKALWYAIDAEWIVEDEEATTAGGSPKRSLRLGNREPS